MKTFSLIKPALLALTIFMAASFALKAQSTKNVAVNNFNEVSVSAGIELHIIQGNTESAKIIAVGEVINDVVIEKNGDNLKVGWKENWGFNNRRKNRSAKVYVSYKKLNSISASSGSSLKTDNTLKTDRLNASVSSGASMNAQISCNELTLNASSGASAAINGNATHMILESSSGSSVNTGALPTQYAKVNTSSGSDVTVNVSKALEIQTSSGSSLRYKGDPAIKMNNKDRSSSVSKIN